MESTWEAARTTVRKLGLDVVREFREGSRGTIETRRGDGAALTLSVQAVDASSTRVDVASERDEPDSFAVVLDRLDQEVKSVPSVQGQWNAGSTLTTRTFASIDRARAAGRTALARLGYFSTPDRPDASTFELLGRRNDGSPARIVLAPNALGGTDVTFIVGTEPSPANDAVARQLRDEFEKSLIPTSSD